jgi:hypothetical protein
VCLLELLSCFFLRTSLIRPRKWTNYESMICIISRHFIILGYFCLRVLPRLYVRVQRRINGQIKARPSRWAAQKQLREMSQSINHSWPWIPASAGHSCRRAHLSTSWWLNGDLLASKFARLHQRKERGSVFFLASLVWSSCTPHLQRK